MGTVEKLPTLWSKDPSVWFAVAESHFNVWNVTKSSTKFSHVIVALPEQIAIQTRDLIMHPHPVEPYERFKTAFLKRLGDSEQNELERPLSSEEMGDRKSSELISRLKEIGNEGRMDQPLILELFLQCLTAHARRILSSAKTLPVDELASLADSLVSFEDTSQESIVHASSVEEITRALCKQIETLNNNFQKMYLASSPSPSPLTKEYPKSGAKFNHVHMAIIGPLPSSDGFTHIFTCIDCSTKWPEAVPMEDGTAETVVRAFVQCWISRFGVPSIVTAGNDSQFESTAFRDLFFRLGIKFSCPTVCERELMEDFHSELRKAIGPFKQALHRWTDHLPFVLLGLRAIRKTGAVEIPAEKVYETSINLPVCSSAHSDLDYLQVLDEYMQKFKEKPYVD